ncbi:low temperature requirement protein A [Micromonospora luteifusca]|uniref:low temperature requirement protein A n=1 Tax=Micromonospora luteifusca TaxID=709860 RepID=UPI0033AED0B2
MTTSRAGRLLRKPEDPQRATFLELFFDLAFVYVLTQLSRVLSQDLTWRGAFHTLVLLLAVWWVWCSTATVPDRFDPQRPTIQLLVIATLVGSLVMAVALPAVFGAQGLVFAGAYVAVQAGRSIGLLIVLRGHELQRGALRVVIWFCVSAVPWIAGALVHGTAREALWALAVVIDYLAGKLRYLTPGLGRSPPSELPSAAEHLAERHRQFFIIALGELILVAASTLGVSGFAPDRTAAFLVSIATTVLLWRIYIYRAGELSASAIAGSRDPARLGLSAFYAHLVMVAGVVVAAVGTELVITHPFGHPEPAWVAVILGGPALFLVGRSRFEYVVFSRVSLDRPIGLLALAAVAPLMLLLPPLVAALAVTAVLTGITISDAARARGRSPEPPSPPG